METINERIQFIINQHYNGNVTAFAREVGVTQGTIRDIVSGRMNSPTAKTIKKMLNVKTVNISSDWLLTGEGPIEKGLEIMMTTQHEEVLKQRVEIEILRQELAFEKKRYEDLFRANTILTFIKEQEENNKKTS